MTECPNCGSATYPLLGGAVTCTNPDCPRYNRGWDPDDLPETRNE